MRSCVPDVAGARYLGSQSVSHSLQAQHDSLVHPPLGIDTPTHAGEQWHGAGSLRHAARAGSRRGTPRAQTRPRIHTQLTLHTHT